MQPNLLPGDLVIYKPIKYLGFNFKKGTMVIANHPIQKKVKIIKRIYECSSAGVNLRGDNDLSSTDSRHYGLVNNEYILGIVELIVSFR